MLFRSAAEIQQLNNAFKQMDTKTSRQQLNELAADAGRLGLNTVESVLGYVRAADKVNIALSDLGADATLTLTKLAGVFGVTQQKGTEGALLSVGSAITEMANSCAASAGGVAEFTNRLGGVGSQAGLTLPQITAMGAVFENSGVSVEKSSTAMQKLISDLAVNTEKIGNAAGIKDMKEFTRLVKEDMNGALLMLFDTLRKNSSFANLAPIFAEMGEKGSGVVQTLATMAGNVDFLRQQQEKATTAFEKATAVGDAYNKQNNTMQARLDRVNKNLTEVWITLGEKLAPILPGLATAIGVVAEILTTTITAVSDLVKWVGNLAEKFEWLKTALNAIKAPFQWIIDKAEQLQSLEHNTDKLREAQEKLLKTEDKIRDTLKGNKEALYWFDQGDIERALQIQEELATGAGKAEKKKYKALKDLAGEYKYLTAEVERYKEKVSELDPGDMDSLGTQTSQLGARTSSSALPDGTLGMRPSSSALPDDDMRTGTSALQEDPAAALQAELAAKKQAYEQDRLQLLQLLADKEISEQEYQDRVKQLYIQHLADVALLYAEDTDEREDAELKHCEALLNYHLWLQKEEQRLLDEQQKEEDRRRKEEEKKRKEEQEKQLEEEQELAEQRQQIHSAVASFIGDTFSQAMSSASSYISASMEADVAKVTAEYDKKIQAAEGDKDEQERLEQEKQKKIASIKNAANKKQTTIQIMQALASTAQSAIEAYKSMAGIPVVGPALGAMAAAAATAFGMMQVATIRKQAKAQEAQGYAQGGLVSDYATGGYTRKGQKYEAVGTVHAGEYVIPQEMVSDPAIAPTINTLEAVRQNRIKYISNGASGTSYLERNRPRPQENAGTDAVGDDRTPSGLSQQNDIQQTLKALNEKLQQPLIAHVTVAGDYGVQQAMDEYNRFKQRATK